MNVLSLNTEDRGYLPDNSETRRSTDYRCRIRAMTAWLNGIPTEELYGLTFETLKRHAVLYGLGAQLAEHLYGRECECRLK